VKFKHVIAIVFLILLIDQVLKIYIKTHFTIGEEVNVIGTWFKLHFIENEGMAFGMSFGGSWGKLALTLFRLVAVCLGFFFIKNTLIKQQYSNGLIICASLILAGAMGNLIDSIFYGKIFTESPPYFHTGAAAKFVSWGQGYEKLFHGRVVDMFYFPIIETTYPKWFPVWGGQPFSFFRAIFNVADASISCGVMIILFFQKWILTKKNIQHETLNS
jgi:signal peptidase II